MENHKIQPIIKVKRNSIVISSQIIRLEMDKLEGSQKISNGKRRGDVDIGGWIKKLLFSLSKECLVNMCMLSLKAW